MKIKCILLFILVGNILSAQSLTELDRRNGFQHFTLGMDISEIKDVVRWDENGPNSRVKVYDYTGKDIPEIFLVPVSYIMLTFLDEKLMAIRIDLSSPYDDYTNEEYNRVNYSLEKLFGEINYIPANETGGIRKGKIWEGQSVTLENLQISYTDPESKPRPGEAKLHGYVNIYSKELKQKRIARDF